MSNTVTSGQLFFLMNMFTVPRVPLKSASKGYKFFLFQEKLLSLDESLKFQ